MFYLFISHISTFWITTIYYHNHEKSKSSLLFTDMLPNVFFNQLIITPIYFYMFHSYFNFNYPLFSLFYPIIVILKVLLTIIIYNLCFALIHFTFHRIKFLFKYIHYVHHQLIIPDSIGTIYCHPIEHILTNLTPLIISTVLLQNDYLIMLISIIFMTYQSIIGHIPFKSNKSIHNLHHSLFNVNFDNYPYILDKFLFKTYRKYKVI